MKRLILFLTITLMSISLQANDKLEKRPATQQEMERMKELHSRIYEIKAINFNEISTLEKRNLKNELKEIKKELRTIHGGVYFSLGALVVIVILLIILL